MQGNPNVDISQTTAVLCEECNGPFFEQALGNMATTGK